MSNLEKVASAAKNFVCDLYRTQPRNIIPVLSDIHQFWWDGFCGDPPRDPAQLPPPPKPPYEGGQCNCIKYRVKMEATGGGLGTNVIPTDQDVWGEIQGIGLVPVTGMNAQKLEITCRGNAGNCGAAGQKVVAIQWGSTPTNPPPSYKIISIARVDGKPDNCGSLPAEYPPAPPVPPGGYISPPTPITFNDNTVKNFYFKFVPPPLPIPTKFLPPIIVNFNAGGINPKFDIDIKFNFDGTINFGDVGGGDGGNEFNENDRKKLDDIFNRTGDSGDKITNLTNEINNITNNYNNAPPNPDDFEPPVEDIPPGEYEHSYLAGAFVVLKKIPKNAKTQAGNAAADVIYAGWFQWKKAGYNCPREPIHFKDNFFVAPKGVDGFAYTLYTGYDGTATALINKERV